MHDLIRTIGAAADNTLVAFWTFISFITLVIVLVYGVRILILLTSILGAILALCSYVLGTSAECLIIASHILSHKSKRIEPSVVKGHRKARNTCASQKKL